MACPKCGCKVHYQYDNGDDFDCSRSTEQLERCAACRHVFDIEDAAPDDDDEFGEPNGNAGVGERDAS